MVTVSAPAKVNLTLNIEGRREDGYHLLSSVFQSVLLCDTVTVSLSEREGIHLTLSDPLLPTDARNTAYKAAQLFFETIGQPPAVSVYVEKRIPQQAGLGGGSADAAGVLVGLNALYDAGLSLDALCTLGEKVGADVPFCIKGGTAMVTGIGEIIEPLPAMPVCPMVIAKPKVGVSTKEAYAAVDSKKTVFADQDAMRSAIADGDLPRIGSLLCNAFEQALAIPEVEDVVRCMKTFSPYGCAMSGSGSAVFGLFRSESEALECKEVLLKSGVDAVLCAPAPLGAQVVEKG